MKITVEQDTLIIKDPGSFLAKVRALPKRDWKAATGWWYCPYVKEIWFAMRDAGFPIEHIPCPKVSGYRIEFTVGENYIHVYTLRNDDVVRCRKIPEYRSFSPKHNAWICRATRLNVQYLSKVFTDAEWSPGAKTLQAQFGKPQRQSAGEYAHLLGRQRKTVDLSQPPGIEFRTKPFTHQLEAFLAGRDMENFAYFMEQGTGKSYVAMYDGLFHYQVGFSEGMLILCPNGVKDSWEEMLREHLPEGTPLDIFVWETKTRHKAEEWVLKVEKGRKKFRVLIMNIEAMSSQQIGFRIANLFVSKHDIIGYVDESSRIKSHSAQRTKNCWKIGKKCVKRRILTGTPVTQSPLDLYSQFYFLDPYILGCSKFQSFKDRYAIEEGTKFKTIIGYTNLEELVELIEPYNYRITKAECLDLPEKIFEKRSITLTPEQKALYEQARDEMLVELNGQTNVMQFAITQLQVLQRIVGGFVPLKRLNEELDEEEKYLEPIPGPNPKLNELMEICDELDGQKVIIWARYRAELALIVSTLREKYGHGSVAEFFGGVDKATRTKGRRDFQKKDSVVRFFVGQPQVGGIGITLTEASTVVYYSNTHSLEDRLQSEDRAHRIGQTKNVTFIDLVAKGTMDVRLIGGLRRKKSLADIITGDPTFAWL